jgi:hypothetical protein
MVNNRMVTWTAAGFLLGFGVPLRDPTIRSLSDVLLASLAVAMIPTILGFLGGLARRKRPTDEIDHPAALVALAALTIIWKVLQPDGFSLVPAVIFIWLVWVKD